jgi:cobalt-zinc-cadmium efflux system membrane fusion protein
MLALSVAVRAGEPAAAPAAAPGAPRSPAEHAVAPAPASFKPSREQLAGLRLATVGTARFRTEHVTDGKIAVNGERSTAVYSPYSGRVTALMARPGDTVRAGQVLFTVEASEFVQGRNDLLSTRAAWDAALAARDLALGNEQRKHALFEAQAGSRQDWDQSRSDLAAAQAQERSAGAAHEAARGRLAILGVTPAQLDGLLERNGALVGAGAAVLAPIDGVVTDRQIGPGQYVQAAAANPAYTVANLDTVWLVANLPEADAPHVRPGDSIEASLYALPERALQARVDYVAPGLDPNTHRLVVRAVLDNPGHRLRPEMFARVTVVTGGSASAPAVPLSGVVYEGATPHVWVLAADGSLVRRDLRAGRQAGGLLEVLEGVKVGEKVLASGALFIDRASQGD